MHEIVDKMLARPIATIVIASCVTNGVCTGIAKIITAVKGTNVRPVVNVYIPNTTSKNT